MKSKIYLLASAVIASTLLTCPLPAQSGSETPEQQALTHTILHLDSLFWQAYNTCDVETMGSLLTDDIEFYHDKGGLTTTKKSLLEGLKRNLCSNADFRLRREEVKGSLGVYPLNNYGAILTGEHVFYINQKGRAEYLDGMARFTHVWRHEEGVWKMARVLSYDHKPAPADFENK